MNNKMLKKSISHLYRVPRPQALLAAVFAALFSMGSMAQVSVDISFDNSGCPQPGVPLVTAGHGKKVTWQAVDAAGSELLEPTSRRPVPNWSDSALRAFLGWASCPYVPALRSDNRDPRAASSP